MQHLSNRRFGWDLFSELFYALGLDDRLGGHSGLHGRRVAEVVELHADRQKICRDGARGCRRAARRWCRTPRRRTLDASPWPGRPTMPFCPLPATFLDDLTRAGDRGVLELGCAEGGFTRLLREQGASVVTLDRRRSAAAVVGDALAPPLRAGSFPVVVAANLLRHLWRRVDPEHGPRGLARPRRARRLPLHPGGRAGQGAAAVRNYRDLQAFLARLHDLQRGPLLPSGTFAAARRRWRWPGRWQDGMRAEHLAGGSRGGVAPCWPASGSRPAARPIGCGGPSSATA